jgi:uncharacterized protein YaaQ
MFSTDDKKVRPLTEVIRDCCRVDNKSIIATGLEVAGSNYVPMPYSKLIVVSNAL